MILASWYGVLAQMLWARGRLPIRRLSLIDRDPLAAVGARALNNALECQGRLAVYTRDIFQIEDLVRTEAPDLVINTSCEHLPSSGWLDAFPKGTLVALQSTDLSDPDHIRIATSVDGLRRQYEMIRPVVTDTLDIRYPNSSYRRFTLVGRVF